MNTRRPPAFLTPMTQPHTQTITVADPPQTPPDPRRVELVDGLLAALRERLLAADRFDYTASCPVVQQGWENAPCGTRWPRFRWGNTATYHFEIIEGPTPAEYR